jgi:hypothetical protein
MALWTTEIRQLLQSATQPARAAAGVHSAAPPLDAAAVALYALAASGAVAWLWLLAITFGLLQMRPWSAQDRDHSTYMARLPRLVFALGCRTRQFGAWLTNQIPAPLLATELASAFLKSQVLFAIVDLGIPDALKAAGSPQTASQLAVACGGKQVEWLDRLLQAAAALGLLTKRRARRRGKGAPPLDPLTGVDEFEYGANAATVALQRGSRSSVAAMVRLYQYNYASSARLAEVRSGPGPGSSLGRCTRIHLPTIANTS